MSRVARLFLVSIFVLAWPFDGAAGVEIVKVSIDKSCKHDIDARKTLKRENRDVLVWRIENECPTAQKVLICARPAPPLRCFGDPEAAKISTQFQIGAAQGDKVTAAIVCTVKWPPKKPDTKSYNYNIDLYTGPATGKNLKCPIKPLDHELALEVVP